MANPQIFKKVIEKTTFFFNIISMIP